MPCVVCDHTLEQLGVPGKRLAWCPRCGTIHDEDMQQARTQSPLLVQHVQRLVRSLNNDHLAETMPVGLWVPVIEAAGLRRGS